MACDIPGCVVVLRNETYCYTSPCNSGGQNYPKTMASNKLLGCDDGSTVPCQQPRVGCCY